MASALFWYILAVGWLLYLFCLTFTMTTAFNFLSFFVFKKIKLSHCVSLSSVLFVVAFAVLSGEWSTFCVFCGCSRWRDCLDTTGVLVGLWFVLPKIMLNQKLFTLTEMLKVYGKLCENVTSKGSFSDALYILLEYTKDKS